MQGYTTPQAGKTLGIRRYYML